MRLSAILSVITLAIAAACAFTLSAHAGGHHEAEAEAHAVVASASTYTLNVCPVSMESLSDAKSPKTIMHEDREVRLCCPMCAGKFKRDPDKYLEKVDAMLVESQMPYYPLDTCVVARGALGGMGEPVNYMYANRLVRFCCAGCTGRFEKHADEYIAKLDAAVIAKQSEAYPLDRCVVADDELEYVEPIEFVAGSRLVRLCCEGCVEEFQKNPGAYVARIDAAWEAQRGKH